MSGENETPREVKNGDRRLRNWTKWQEEWEKIQGRIAQTLDLPPGDLLVNFGEGLQNMNQEKLVLEYTKIPTEFDKWRGKPDFYKLPNALSEKFTCCCKHEPRKLKYCCSKLQQCICCRKTALERVRCCTCRPEPTYFLVKTKPESYIVPSVDLSGVPERIRMEKNILNGTRNIYQRWQNSKYRQQQMNLWAEKIQNIVPHWPHYDELVVVGTKISPPKEEASAHNVSEADDLDKLEDAGDNEHDGQCPTSKKLPRLALKVNGIFLTDCDSEGTRKLRMFFEYDISASEMSVDFLHFENKGTATMRISWQKLEKFRLFRNYTQEKCEKHGFYFDKKELVILPGHNVHVPVWFKTENSGNFSESWEIITTPRVCHENFHFILILESYAYYKDLQEKVNLILKYIDIRARNMLIKDILYDLLERVRYVETPTIPCFYGTPQLFEMANLVNGRPLYLFDEKFVEELREIYNKVKIQQIPWEYSIKCLIKLAHRKDTSIYLENKSTELTEKIKRVEGEQLKGITEKSASQTKKGKKDKKEKVKNKGDKSKKSKKSKSPSKTSHIGSDVQPDKPTLEPEPYEYSNQLNLWNVVKKFDSPVIINLEREKYFACSKILNAYFNKMCHLLDEVEAEKGVTKNSKYPLVKNKLIPASEQPERLIYEYYEHHYVPVHFSRDFYPFEGKRKPKIVKDIPSDDIEALYTTYFNKSINPNRDESKTKKGKKGKSKSPKGGKSKNDKESKKSKKTTKDKIIKEVSVQSFNPYAEHFEFVPDSENVVSEEEEKITKISKANIEDYNYKQYLVVYSCLSHAVDAIVDTLGTFECIVPYPTLNELKTQMPNDDQELKEGTSKVKETI